MNYLNFAVETAERAGKVLYDSFRIKSAKKRGTSKEVKSTFDRVADDIIISSIENSFPTYSYFTEETGFVKKDDSLVWVVDPLDGTGNFESHNPFFSVAISLWKEGEPVVSVIEAPALQERFLAVRNEGAFLIDCKSKRKKQVNVSLVEKSQDAYVVFCEGGEKDKKRIVEFLSRIYTSSKDLRKIGSASLELAFLGAGRVDGYITFQIPFYDLAAGLLFLQEAGGLFYNFQGEKLSFKDFQINKSFDFIADNGKIGLERLA